MDKYRFKYDHICTYPQTGCAVLWSFFFTQECRLANDNFVHIDVTVYMKDRYYVSK